MDSLVKGPKDKDDILLVHKPDRRKLDRVPDQEKLRKNYDRRYENKQLQLQSITAIRTSEAMGQRYTVDYKVVIQCRVNGRKEIFHAHAIDISTTGMLLEVPSQAAQAIEQAITVRLKFVITPGSMPEGYEMKVDIGAKYIRFDKNADGKLLCGLVFSETLAQYAARKKTWLMISIASAALFFITCFIMLMRAESVLYFKFNKMLYTYSIIAATFLLTRYLFACFYRPVPIDKDFTPSVTVVIPCFNEEKWISRTILSCVNQDYPLDKLEVIVVDDCSNDGSVAQIQTLVAELHAQHKQFDVDKRLRYLLQQQNAGKREALARGTLAAKHELVVFVDSDSFLDPFAIRHLVQPFKDAKMGGVTGRTDVANTFTNALTKMQAVRYFIAFRIMKAAEACFDAVTCLSGPISCYRKQLVIKHMDAWLDQTFLGEKATFGDDRSMTNLILKENRTGYQDTAVCSTIVPNQHRVFLKQQMRWKRSWLRESLIAASFMWKKEPFMALSFYMGVLVPLIAPLIVLYNLIYIPVFYRVLPTTFIIGISLMALLMSMAQLFLRKSSTWIFGLWFCLYYEAVLLWQMPIAWVTFWKTTWGTRMTPADLAVLFKKNRKMQQRM